MPDPAGTPAPALAPKPVRHLKRKRRPQKNKAKTIAQRQKAQKKIILDCLRQGMTVQGSCEKAGVSAWSFPYWCRQDKRFCEEAVKARQEIRPIMVDDALYAAAVGKNVLAQIAWKKIHGSDHERRALSHVSVSGEHGGPVKLEHTLAGLFKAAMNDNGTGGGNGDGRKHAGGPGEAVRLPPAEGGAAGAVRGAAGLGAGGGHNRLPAGAGEPGAKPGADQAGGSGSLGQRGDQPK